MLMGRINIPVVCCDAGDVLAEDIFNQKGVLLAVKNTVMNHYIKRKLLEFGINDVWLYQPAGLFVHEAKASKKEKVEKNYKKAVFIVKKFLSQICSGGTIDYGLVNEISNTILEVIYEPGSIAQCLSELKHSDEYTYTHCVNVAFYSMLIAKWLKTPDSLTQEVIQAGLLHDIGKTKVSKEILNKKEKLTSAEWKIIKKHSQYGYEMIKDIPGISQGVLTGVLQHHERMDGSGYPGKLSGDNIGLHAKIIAVADVYDAMTQNRVYKRKVSPFESFRMFLTSGICSFDTHVLGVFLKHLPAYYIGERARLNNGLQGEIVYIPPHDVIYPIVQIGSNFLDLSKDEQLKVVDIMG